MKAIDLFKRHGADLVGNQWIAVIAGKHTQIGVRTAGVDSLTDEGHTLAGRTDAKDLAAVIAEVADPPLASTDPDDAEAVEKADIVTRLLALGEPKPGTRTGLPKLQALLAAAEAKFAEQPGLALPEQTEVVEPVSVADEDEDPLDVGHDLDFGDEHDD